jgi:hypothetical protein
MSRIGLSRRRNSEKEIADAHLGSFNVATSRGWYLVMRMTKGRNPSLPVLIRLAELLSAMSQIQFPRDMRRRRALIVKWIDDHFNPFALLVSIIEFNSDGNSK